MNAVLFRQRFKTHIYGLLFIGGELFHTLELPWLENRSNISCVPSGIYETSYLARSASGKYQKVWHLKEVPGRSGILMHSGNLVSHTRGCILIGTKRGRLAGQSAVLGSRTALRNLLTLIGKQDFTLTIIGNENA